jgi:hypothetical protein
MANRVLFPSPITVGCLVLTSPFIGVSKKLLFASVFAPTPFSVNDFESLFTNDPPKPTLISKPNNPHGFAVLYQASFTPLESPVLMGCKYPFTSLFASSFPAFKKTATSF